MNGLSLLHPEWLPAAPIFLGLLAAATGAAILHAQRRRRRLLASAGPVSGKASDGILLIALVAIGIAAVGPRIGTRTERISTSGVDVVVLIDVSRSMDARDLPPSRLDRALQTSAALLAGLEPGDRAALAAFAGEAVLLTPLTPDRAALADLLPGIDTDLIQPGSSRLSKGVAEALTAFDLDSDRARLLVVLSDGEDADGTPLAGVAEMQRMGVRGIAVALGTESGGTIPRQGMELRDLRGQIVTTRVDAARLGSLADATGGLLIRPDAFGAVDPATLLAAVRRDAPHGEPGEPLLRQVPAVRVAPFALAAILLLVLEASAGPRRATPVVATALIGGLLLGANGGSDRDAGEARRFDLERFRSLPSEAQRSIGHDPDALFTRGLALAERGAWAEAERAFLAAALAAGDAYLAADAYHDAGVAALNGGRLDAARDAFLESLAAAPSPATRFNLEWTLRALAADPPPPPPPTGRSRAADASEEEELRPEPAPTRPDEAASPPEPRPEPRTGPARGREADKPPPLDPAEAERWLARVEEDPTRALRGLGAQHRGPTRGSTW